MFLKLDVQGYERLVLAGGKASLPRVHGLQLEMSLVPLYQGEASYTDLLGEMTALGFQLMSHRGGVSRPAFGTAAGHGRRIFPSMISLSPRGRSLLWVAQVALALGLILLLLRAASPEQIWSLRHRISYGYWLWAVVLLLAMHGLGAASILVLLTIGPGAPRGRLVLAYGHVQALALFTPAQAAEALLPLLYSRAGIEAGETAAALLVQRLVTLGLVVAASLLFAAHWLPPGALPLVAVLAVGGLLVVALVVRSPYVRLRFPRVGGFRPACIGPAVDCCATGTAGWPNTCC